jgi:uncharacterized protein YkwD
MILKKYTVFMLLACAFMMSNCSKLSDIEEELFGPADVQSYVQQFNNYRVEKELDELTWHSGLYEVALLHNEDMISNHYFSHTNLVGETPGNRLNNEGYTYISVGENLAKGHFTAESVLAGWLNSPEHRAVIEMPEFTHHAVAYNTNGHYWTHIFARNPYYYLED